MLHPLVRSLGATRAQRVAALSLSARALHSNSSSGGGGAAVSRHATPAAVGRRQGGQGRGGGANASARVTAIAGPPASASVSASTGAGGAAAQVSTTALLCRPTLSPAAAVACLRAAAAAGAPLSAVGVLCVYARARESVRRRSCPPPSSLSPASVRDALAAALPRCAPLARYFALEPDGERKSPPTDGDAGAHSTRGSEARAAQLEALLALQLPPHTLLDAALVQLLQQADTRAGAAAASALVAQLYEYPHAWTLYTEDRSTDSGGHARGGTPPPRLSPCQILDSLVMQLMGRRTTHAEEKEPPAEANERDTQRQEADIIEESPEASKRDNNEGDGGDDDMDNPETLRLARGIAAMRVSSATGGGGGPTLADLRGLADASEAALALVAHHVRCGDGDSDEAERTAAAWEAAVAAAAPLMGAARLARVWRVVFQQWWERPLFHARLTREEEWTHERGADTTALRQRHTRMARALLLQLVAAAAAGRRDPAGVGAAVADYARALAVIHRGDHGVMAAARGEGCLAADPGVVAALAAATQRDAGCLDASFYLRSGAARGSLSLRDVTVAALLLSASPMAEGDSAAAQQRRGRSDDSAMATDAVPRAVAEQWRSVLCGAAQHHHRPTTATTTSTDPLDHDTKQWSAFEDMCGVMCGGGSHTGSLRRCKDVARSVCLLIATGGDSYAAGRRGADDAVCAVAATVAAYFTFSAEESQTVQGGSSKTGHAGVWRDALRCFSTREEQVALTLAVLDTLSDAASSGLTSAAALADALNALVADTAEDTLVELVVEEQIRRRRRPEAVALWLQACASGGAASAGNAPQLEKHQHPQGRGRRPHPHDPAWERTGSLHHPHPHHPYHPAVCAVGDCMVRCLNTLGLSGDGKELAAAQWRAVLQRVPPSVFSHPTTPHLSNDSDSEVVLVVWMFWMMRAAYREAEDGTQREQRKEAHDSGGGGGGGGSPASRAEVVAVLRNVGAHLTPRRAGETDDSILPPLLLNWAVAETHKTSLHSGDAADAVGWREAAAALRRGAESRRDTAEATAEAAAGASRFVFAALPLDTVPSRAHALRVLGALHAVEAAQLGRGHRDGSGRWDDGQRDQSGRQQQPRRRPALAGGKDSLSTLERATLLVVGGAAADGVEAPAAAALQSGDAWWELKGSRHTGESDEMKRLYRRLRAVLLHAWYVRSLRCVLRFFAAEAHLLSLDDASGAVDGEEAAEWRWEWSERRHSDSTEETPQLLAAEAAAAGGQMLPQTPSPPRVPLPLLATYVVRERALRPSAVAAASPDVLSAPPSPRGSSQARHAAAAAELAVLLDAVSGGGNRAKNIHHARDTDMRGRAGGSPALAPPTPAAALHTGLVSEWLEAAEAALAAAASAANTPPSSSPAPPCQREEQQQQQQQQQQVPPPPATRRVLQTLRDDLAVHTPSTPPAAAAAADGAGGDSGLLFGWRLTTPALRLAPPPPPPTDFDCEEADAEAGAPGSVPSAAAVIARIERLLGGAG